MIEGVVWWLCAPIKAISEKPRNFFASKFYYHMGRLVDYLELVAVLVLSTVCRVLLRDREKSRTVKWRIADKFRHWRSLPGQVWWDRLFFRPAESTNCIWLLYICFSQTLGAYRNVSTLTVTGYFLTFDVLIFKLQCDCMSSYWTYMGGYIDFNSFNEAQGPNVIKFWIIGCVVGCSSMCFGLFYIIQYGKDLQNGSHF